MAEQNDFEEIPISLQKQSMRPLRLFSGTYNVRGRPNMKEDGMLEKIPPEEVTPWIRNMIRDGEPLPDLLFFSLEEVMDLSSLNVVIDSINPSEDHYNRVIIWRNAILSSLNNFTQAQAQPHMLKEGKYKYVGQSTMVGLVLLVFSTEKMSSQLFNIQTGCVKTGWGGFLGNKGSSMWRCEIGREGGPSLCAVASHFASGRVNISQRNECYDNAIHARVFKRVVEEHSYVPSSHTTVASTTGTPQISSTSSAPASATTAITIPAPTPPPPPPKPKPPSSFNPASMPGSQIQATPASKPPPKPNPQPVQPRGRTGGSGGRPGIPASHMAPMPSSRRERSKSPFRDRPISASRIFGEAMSFGNALTSKMEGMLFEESNNSSNSNQHAQQQQQQLHQQQAQHQQQLRGPKGSIDYPIYPPPTNVTCHMYGVLDHDLLIWAGDLNYALNEPLEIDEAIQTITGIKPFTEPAPLPPSWTGGAQQVSKSTSLPGACAVSVTDHWHEEYNALDQLKTEKAAGRIFNAFFEGPLHFRPTYRVIAGEDNYDPKRCPAWTDRVLWRERKLIGKLGPLNKAPPPPGIAAVKCVAYSCAWDCKLSDHKPVFALLDVDLSVLSKPKN